MTKMYQSISVVMTYEVLLVDDIYLKLQSCYTGWRVV